MKRLMEIISVSQFKAPKHTLSIVILESSVWFVDSMADKQSSHSCFPLVLSNGCLLLRPVSHCRNCISLSNSSIALVLHFIFQMCCKKPGIDKSLKGRRGKRMLPRSRLRRRVSEEMIPCWLVLCVGGRKKSALSCNKTNSAHWQRERWNARVT